MSQRRVESAAPVRIAPTRAARAGAPQAGPTTARGWRTRAKLLKAARALFEKNGYLDTNINDISRRARVAYGTFYTYFSSKEEIFAEVVHDLIENFRVVAHSEPPATDEPAARIARANRGYLRAYRANAGILAVIEQVASFNPRLAEVRREAHRYWIDRAQRLIARLQDDGLVDAYIDPAYAAFALGLMVDRSAYFWHVLGEPYDEDVAVEQLTRLYCNALRLSPPQP